MKQIKYKTAVERFRYQLRQLELILRVSRSIVEKHNLGECYIVDINNRLVNNGNLEDLMREFKSLKVNESIKA